jgi:hypothetical protein
MYKSPVFDWIRGVPTAADLPVLDTTKYVVLPFTAEGAVPPLALEDRLADALAAWNGISVTVSSAVATAGSNANSASAQTRGEMARQAGAGRFVTARLSVVGDSVRVYAELYDGNQPSVRLGPAVRNLALKGEHQDEVMRDIASTLLLQGVAPQCLEGGAGTNSLRAVRACDRAFSALEDGKVSEASSAFIRRQADAKYSRRFVGRRNQALGCDLSHRHEGLACAPF